MDSDLYNGYRYSPLEQPGPEDNDTVTRILVQNRRTMDAVQAQTIFFFHSSFVIRYFDKTQVILLGLLKRWCVAFELTRASFK